MVSGVLHSYTLGWRTHLSLTRHVPLRSPKGRARLISPKYHSDEYQPKPPAGYSGLKVRPNARIIRPTNPKIP